MIKSPSAIIEKHRTEKICEESLYGGGNKRVDIAVNADTLLLSLYALNVVGTIDVSVYSYGDTKDRNYNIITFPTITDATDTLIIKKAATTLKNVFIDITYSDSGYVEIFGKGLGIGESSVRILGANSGNTSQKTIGSTPTRLIEAGLADRIGLTVRNFDPTQLSTNILYYAFSEAACNSATGFPVFPNDVSSIDVGAGVDVWAVSPDGDVDVRVLEGGS